MSEHGVGERPAERDQPERRRDDDQQVEPHPVRQVRPDEILAVVGGMPAHPGQQCGDDRDGHDRVGQLEELEGVAVGRECGRTAGQADYEQVGELGDEHVEEHPAGQAAGLKQARVAQVEPRAVAETGAAQRREQRDRHDDDSERGPGGQHRRLSRRDSGQGRRARPPDMRTKAIAVAMTIRLFRTGVNMGAPNLPRMFRMAPMVAPIPIEDHLRQEASAGT